jgi:integrase
MTAAHPNRATRRADAAAFVDDKFKLRVLRPKDPNGKGEARAWRYSYVDTRTKTRVTGRFYGTRDEVRREFHRLVADLEARRDSDWRDVSFREVVEEYLAHDEHEWEDGVRRSQSYKVRVLLDRTLLGTATLGDLAYSPKTNRKALKQLTKVISERTGRPYSSNSLALFRDALGTLYSFAAAEELIPAELAPMKGVRAPKAAKGAKQPARLALRRDDDDGDEGGPLVLASEVPSREAALLLGKVWVDRGGGRVDPARRGLAVDLAATSGPRWGELHALQPRDVVWGDVPHLRIDRKLLLGKNGSVIGTSLPKMGKKRVALLSPHLHTTLRALCEQVERDFGPTGWLFPSPMDPNRPYEPDSFGSTMRNFARKAGWPVDEHRLLIHTFHSLRHLACVWQLRDVGVDLVTVSRSMGHASVTFTQNRYLGETSDARVLAAEKFRAYFTDGG